MNLKKILLPVFAIATLNAANNQETINISLQNGTVFTITRTETTAICVPPILNNVPPMNNQSIKALLLGINQQFPISHLNIAASYSRFSRAFSGNSNESASSSMKIQLSQGFGISADSIASARQISEMMPQDQRQAMYNQLIASLTPESIENFLNRNFR